MRVFSLENDKSQRQHNGQTYPQLGSMPGKCGCICTACSPPEGSAGASRGSKNASGKGERCPDGHPPQLQELFPESCLWFNQCHSKWLSPVPPSFTCKIPISFLPSQQVQPHWTPLCLSQGLQGAEDGEEGGHTHTSGTFSVSLLALPVASSWCWWPPHTPPHPSVSLFPAFSSCPTAAGGKSQPLSGETAAGENWSLSSITGITPKAGSLPILAWLCLLYCSCTAHRQTSCVLPTKPGSVWVFS